MRVLLLAWLTLVPQLSLAADACPTAFTPRREIFSDELAQILDKSGVALPERFPTDMSDRAKARVRKLYKAIPNLVGRRLNVRLSLAEGEVAYIIGFLSEVTETEVVISLEKVVGGELIQYRKVNIGDITSVTTAPDLVDATNPEIEAARRTGAGVRDLLGRRVEVRGVRGTEGTESQTEITSAGVVVASFPNGRQMIRSDYGDLMEITVSGYFKAPKYNPYEIY